MSEHPRPETPQATLAVLSDVQSRIDTLTAEAAALRNHLLTLADKSRLAVVKKDLHSR